MAKLKTKHLQYWVETILDYGKNGLKLEQMLLHFDIRSSEWTRYYNKHKKVLDKVVKDAQKFAYAHMVTELRELMVGSMVNQSVVKMYIEGVHGWSDNAFDKESVSPVVNIVVSPSDAEFIEARNKAREKKERE